MELIVVLSTIMVTSAASGVVASRLLRLSLASVRIAMARMFETLGVIVFFAVVNVLAVALVVVGLRTLGLDWASLYAADDASLLVLSLLQGLLLQAWRETEARSSDRRRLP